MHTTVISPEWGFAADGVTDDSDALEAMFADMADAYGDKGSRIIIPADTTIALGRSVNLGREHSNVQLVGEDGARLRKTDPALQQLIFADNVDGFGLEHITIDMLGSTGTKAQLIFQNCQEPTVTECTLLGSRYSIELRTDDDSESYGALIQGNDFTEAFYYAIAAIPSENAHQPRGVRVIDNHCDLITGGGEGPSFVYGHFKGSDFTLNVLEDSTDTGFMMTGGEKVSIYRNRLHTRLVGFFIGNRIQYVSMNDNDITSDGDYGIALLCQPTPDVGLIPQTHAVIADNRIRDCGKTGIRVEGSQFATVRGNDITGCGHLQREADHERAGIAVLNYGQKNPGDINRPADNNSIIGNTIDGQGVTSVGIRIIASPDDPLRNVYSMGNVVDNVTEKAFSNTSNVTEGTVSLQSF